MSDPCQFYTCIRIDGQLVHLCRSRQLDVEVQLWNDTTIIITKIC
jgi:hypothetical protein